jgi:hypothetical protein
VSEQAQQFAFQAEVQRLLDLVVHSLYTHKEIFLRELVSNASDAIDRLRFEALTRPELLPEGHEPKIRLVPDRENRTLSIDDDGIGMTTKCHERNGWNQRNQQAEAVDPDGESQLEEREREIDGIPGEAIGPGADDRRRGPVAGDRRASSSEGADCGDEQTNGQEHEHGACRCSDRGWDNPHWPGIMDCQAERDRAQVHERGADETEVCGVRQGGFRTAVTT